MWVGVCMCMCVCVGVCVCVCVCVCVHACMCDCAWWRSTATYSTITWTWLAVMSSYEIWGHWSLVWLDTWQVYLTHSAKNNVPMVVISICFPFGNFPPQCLFQVNFLHVIATHSDHHSRAVTSLQFHRWSSFILYNNIALQRNPVWRFLNHCSHQATGSTAKEQQHAHKLHTTTWSLSLSLNFSCRALITHVTSFQPTRAEKWALETG